MRILSIESSCDETGVAVMDFSGDVEDFTATVLGNALSSQAEKHAEYGGVYPTLAKREHSLNAVPLMTRALDEAGLLTVAERSIAPDVEAVLRSLLSREHSLFTALVSFLRSHARPELDAIAVTQGPGLEPALWVGVNFAKALSLAWDIPLIPLNHMEGHVIAAMVERQSTDVFAMRPAIFPVLALLISGAHTELALMKRWIDFVVVGTTRDDAVGEAYDKVARMLGLPYPGGFKLSQLAEVSRRNAHVKFSHPITITCNLPRPMMKSPDCDFSFSGLKTAVLYLLKDVPELTQHIKEKVAHEFEEAVADVLTAKTARAIDITGANTLVIGGGVASNAYLRKRFEHMKSERFPNMNLYVPEKELATDNAIMMGMAAYVRLLTNPDEVYEADEIRAEGNLRLAGERLSFGAAE